ncbi:Sodium/hydrogen exchanger 7 [Symbiodinium microadriaticum]|uniref:Sodium/hydrogen exchanger 7 n=1 Tax=Symbiodinium microadriaticum TaxID=2951 RepID=A0A1Q9EQ96_SYMMI|nr:Sodium/hydrogen exchanger 7 [Symbiodinium microadriaticum]
MMKVFRSDGTSRLIVGLSLMETLIEVMASMMAVPRLVVSVSQMDSSHLRVMRFARLARALRGVIKLLRYIGALRTIIFSIISTMSSLLIVTDDCRYPKEDHARVRFQDSILTLFMAITGGLSWGEALDPLFAVSYIAVAPRAQHQSQRGVFCNTAIESARADKVLADCSFLRIFKEIDQDESNLISIKELKVAIIIFAACFLLFGMRHSMDISTQDIWVIDADGSGEISLEAAFGRNMKDRAEGCKMRLKSLRLDFRKLRSYVATGSHYGIVREYAWVGEFYLLAAPGARVGHLRCVILHSAVSPNPVMLADLVAGAGEVAVAAVMVFVVVVVALVVVAAVVAVAVVMAVVATVDVSASLDYAVRVSNSQDVRNLYVRASVDSYPVLMLKVVLGASLDVTSVLKFFGDPDALIQVITTLQGRHGLCCAYLAFFVAESELSTSGVLVAYYAWPRFVSLEAMEIVWETVEFVGNTAPRSDDQDSDVIFFLAGLLFADTVLESAMHWMAILWIPLNQVGSPVDPREAIAMIWSGLRGAVSLTLAIIIDEEPLVSREMGARIMFHVGGIAALLLINATTAAPLLRALGLARFSFAYGGLYTERAGWLTAHGVCGVPFQGVGKVRVDEDIEGVRYVTEKGAILREMVPELSQEVVAEVPRDAGGETAQAYREAFLNVAQGPGGDARIKPSQPEFLKLENAIAVPRGILPRTSESARLLLSSVDVAIDSAPEILKAAWQAKLPRLNHEGHERGECLRSHLRVQATSVPVLRAPKNQLARLAGEYSMDETMQKSYCVLSFLEAHRQAREVSSRVSENVLEGLLTIGHNYKGFFHNDSVEVQDLVAAESTAEALEAAGNALRLDCGQEQLDEVAELKDLGSSVMIRT